MKANNSLKNPVDVLGELDFSRREILHVDEEGHAQVAEISPAYEIGSDPRDRVAQIIAEDLWVDFFTLAQKKSDQWLMDIAAL